MQVLISPFTTVVILTELTCAMVTDSQREMRTMKGELTKKVATIMIWVWRDVLRGSTLVSRLIMNLRLRTDYLLPCKGQVLGLPQGDPIVASNPLLPNRHNIGPDTACLAEDNE
jgi:hypothetical protein